VRVHCQAAGAPLVADPLYGDESEARAASSLRRHALHALGLRCAHPLSGAPMEICAPLAADMLQAMGELGVSVPPPTDEAAPWTPREGAALRGESLPLPPAAEERETPWASGRGPGRPTSARPSRRGSGAGRSGGSSGRGRGRGARGSLTQGKSDTAPRKRKRRVLNYL